MSSDAKDYGCGCLLVILVIGGIAINDGCEKRARAKRMEIVRQTEVELQQFEQPLPFSGTCRVHKKSYGNSPLQIQSQAGSNYLVKLVDLRTGFAACDVFVQGGTTVKVNVPDGMYEVRYASGNKWYGYDRLFGPGTQYSKADREFTFLNGNGYSLTLYKIRHGNLKTSEIDASEF